MPPRQQQQQQRVLGVALGTHQTTTSNPEENTQYRCGTTDVSILLDEVLNNSTRSVCVYGRVGGIMLEDGTIVEGPDDMVEDYLDEAFTDEEMMALCGVLRYNSSLLAINVSGVLVTDMTIIEMCKALENTRVRLIDLTNTVLDDDTGFALLELAQNNCHLRTIIVDETLIAETIMDEIDMACLNNEAMIPNLPPPPPIDPNRMRYCVGNFFGACPDGAYCAWSHGVPALPKRGEEDRELKEQSRNEQSLKSVTAAAMRTQKELLSTKKLQERQMQRQRELQLETADKKEKELEQFQQRMQQEQQLKQQQEQAAAAAKKKQQQQMTNNASAAAAAASSNSGEDDNDDDYEEIPLISNKLLMKGIIAMVTSGVLSWFVLKKVA